MSNDSDLLGEGTSAVTAWGEVPTHVIGGLAAIRIGQVENVLEPWGSDATRDPTHPISK